jgi:Cap4 dsDNA endonuclease
MSLSSPPDEDRGFETANWYRFQYVVTAVRCLELLLGTTSAVVVEWHSDFVVERSSSAPCFVSVKHREPSRGPWTISAICAEGDLSTLRKRWLAAGPDATCEFLTNGALSSAKHDIQHLAKLMSTGDLASIPDAAMLKLTIGLDCNKQEVLAFLRRLTISSLGGDASTINGILIERAVAPLLARLQMNPLDAKGVLKLAVELVRAVASDAPVVVGEWAKSPSLTPATKLTRTIDAARLASVLELGGFKVGPVDEGVPVNQGSRMTRKLRAGGLGPTLIANAPEMRARWYAIETAFRDDIPAPGFGDEVQKTREVVLAAAISAEAFAKGPASYGSAMHADLLVRLSEGPTVRLPIGPQELMGCAFQLTDECRIWWSDYFDPAFEAPWQPIDE